MKKKKRGWIEKNKVISNPFLKQENENKQDKNQQKEVIKKTEKIYETEKTIDDIKDEDCLDEFFKNYMNEQKNILGNLKQKASKYKEYMQKRNPNIDKIIEKENSKFKENITKEKNDINF